MAGYLGFQRSRYGFIFNFFGVLIIATLVYGITDGLLRNAAMFFMLLTLFGVIFYEFYLSTKDIVEITGESVLIREIYHPIIKWRFIYKKHIFGLKSVLNIEVNLNKQNKPKHIKIKYHDAKGIKEVNVNKRDLADFGSFVKYFTDRTPKVYVTYIK